jgi:hypothetical protein
MRGPDLQVHGFGRALRQDLRKSGGFSRVGARVKEIGGDFRGSALYQPCPPHLISTISIRTIPLPRIFKDGRIPPRRGGRPARVRARLQARARGHRVETALRTASGSRRRSSPSSSTRSKALAKLRPRSCIIDGEAVACGEDGIASFDRIRYRHHDESVFL